jgi:hypothetical protein
MRSVRTRMSEDANPQTDTSFEERASAYLDAIEGMAIPLLVSGDDLPEGELTSLRVASGALRPAFKELTGAFSDSYRERGHQMLWELMKATVDIVHANHNSGIRMRSEDRKAQKAGRESDRIAAVQEAFDAAVDEEARCIQRKLTKGEKFIWAVAPGVKERLRLKKLPGKERIRAAVDRLKGSPPKARRLRK